MHQRTKISLILTSQVTSSQVTSSQVNSISHKDTSRKVPQFQLQNLLTSLAYSTILWTHIEDTMKPSKCFSVSFQWVWRNGKAYG